MNHKESRTNAQFLSDTSVALSLKSLTKHKDSVILSERLSSRMAKCASVLNIGEHAGWQMVVPEKGLIRIAVFGSKSLSASDLEWITERTGKFEPKRGTEPDSGLLNELYELYLPVVEANNEGGSEIGFCTELVESQSAPEIWPVCYSTQFAEIIRTFRAGGAIFRAVLGPASEADRRICDKMAKKSFCNRNIPLEEYIGRPVRARFLLRLSDTPSVRLRTVLEDAVSGIAIRYVGKMSDRNAISVWENPLRDSATYPDYAARIMLMEPELKEAIIGIELSEEKMKRIPASHKNTKVKKAIRLGKATDTTGIKRTITIGDMDLRRHYQIVGQTGTGKSTLLTSMILSAAEQGYGLTFFDPHGTTIDIVLRSLPEKFSDKVRVVRIGDAENPVPFNIWDSDDPNKEEKTISDLCELFSDIFDPKREGFVGPRYERWLSTFAKASIAFLGRRASLESIAVISQSQDNMLKVSKAIIKDYPELVATIEHEYGRDNSNDFHNVLNWYLCKFQRLTSIEQLRKTLGAGANALDFERSIDTDTITLIDLASPRIGTHAARIIGTLMLMKLWNAAMARKKREDTHLVVVDEASLFQTNPMPRMLAESRKFGISMVLCHQHTAQLTSEICEALEANSANFSAFRLSPRDASIAAIRFDGLEMQTNLTRLDAFNAITTLSVDGKQTAPFTLETIRPRKQQAGEKIAAQIEARSIEHLVDPYRGLRALTAAEILNLLNHPLERKWLKLHSPGKDVGTQQTPDWLQTWVQRRTELKLG